MDARTSLLLKVHFLNKERRNIIASSQTDTHLKVRNELLCEGALELVSFEYCSFQLKTSIFTIVAGNDLNEA